MLLVACTLVAALLLPTAPPRCGPVLCSCVYSRSENDGASASDTQPDVPAIEALIDERAALRTDRDFEAADALKAELRRVHKVIINDRYRTWRIAPLGNSPSFEDRRPRRQRGPRDFGPAGHDYSRSPDDGADLSGMRQGQVDDMLRERLEAKFVRDFDRADAILAELRELSVEVNDGRKEWRADGVPFGQEPFRRVGRQAPPEDVEARAAELIERRKEAKKERDYETADELRSQLSDLGVAINDKQRTWTYEGRYGGYERVGPPAIEGPCADDDFIGGLLAKRASMQARDRACGMEIRRVVCA